MKTTCKLFATITFIAISVHLFAQDPEIISSPSNEIICTGENVTYVVKATGTEPFSYEWFFNGTAISGTDNDTLLIPGADETNEGTYYCIVSNTVSSDTTDDFQLLVVTGPPQIIGQAVDSTYCEGTNQQISISTTGENLYYIWTHDDNPISFFGPNVTFTDLSGADNGIYTCTVDNACGTAEPVNIQVNVALLPVIISGPEPVTVCEGDNTGFGVTAEGSDLQYQWFYEGTPLPGENADTLIFENVVADTAGLVSCSIFNECDSINTGEVSLIVNTLPQVTAHPIDHTLCIGANTTLISTATGTPPIAMAWYENGSIIPGADTSHLPINIQPGDTSYYYAAFMNTCGTVYSDSAMIIPQSPPIITQQPVDNEVCLHNTVDLNIKANGSEPLYYQWRRNGVDVDDTNASGAQTANLLIENINEGQSGIYTCYVWNECGDAVSDEAVIEIVMPPNIVSQPDPIIVCEGDSAGSEMMVQGDEPFDYYWVNQDAGDTVSNDESLVFNAITEYEAGTYYAIVSNQCEDVFSDAFEVQVFTYPEFTLQPQDIDACHGDSIALEVIVEGTQPINYMWYKNQSALTSETDTILEFDPAQSLETGYYMCVADNLCGITESDEVLVNIGTIPAITWDPVGTQMCENETLILYADAQGENVFYQWYLNDEPIAGQTDTSLFIPNVSDTMSGEYYFQAYNGCAAANSDTVSVDIAPAPEIDIGENQELCDGEEVVLSAFGDIQSYDWNNGQSNAATITVTETGEYTLAATGDNGCIGYDTVYIEFHPYHYVNLGPDGNYCGPQTLDAEEGAYSYIWNTGSTESSISVTESGEYQVTTEGDAFGCTYSDTVNMSILEQPHVDIGQDHTISIDSTLELCVDNVYDQYNWSNGDPDTCALYSGSVLGEGIHDVWLTVSFSNGCSDTDSIEITVFDDSDITQLSAGESITLYPNPVENHLNLDLNLNEKPKTVEIININGNVVKQFGITENNQYRLNLKSLSSGVYVLRILSTNRHMNFRFIKQ
ncbi:MAG: immunoglobulin domain-containing protein [Bacteroidota bacterium]|nr:immunoglobulin domain-containing protein [Bacteroidota bacterium]